MTIEMTVISVELKRELAELIEKSGNAELKAMLEESNENAYQYKAFNNHVYCDAVSSYLETIRAKLPEMGSDIDDEDSLYDMAHELVDQFIPDIDEDIAEVMLDPHFITDEGLIDYNDTSVTPYKHAQCYMREMLLNEYYENIDQMVQEFKEEQEEQEE